MSVHKNLTGADLHEPKGADTALSGYVYVSNGTGSGVWTLASSIITNTAFTTGDLKPTHKVTADTSWIMWSDGSIGDGSSSATIRANADTADLFALYWNNYNNTLCPVSSGRGLTAVADFAAHKRLSLPVGAGRSLGLAGAGSGLTSRTVGSTTGAENITLAANQIPSLSGTASVTSASSGVLTGAVAGTNITFGNGGSTFLGGWIQGLTLASGTMTSTGTCTITNGSQQVTSIMQPSAYVNVMIKL